MAGAEPLVPKAMSRVAIIATSSLLLAACGNIGDLEPRAGQPLPPKPLMARATPTPEELLTPPAYANPDRVDELMRRSAPRMSDRFDLPPPSGGAPSVPVQANESNDYETDPNSKGPVHPQ